MNDKLAIQASKTRLWAMGFEIFFPSHFLFPENEDLAQWSEWKLGENSPRIYGQKYDEILSIRGIKKPKEWWDFNHPRGNE